MIMKLKDFKNKINFNKDQIYMTVNTKKLLNNSYVQYLEESINTELFKSSKYFYKNLFTLKINLLSRKNNKKYLSDNEMHIIVDHIVKSLSEYNIHDIHLDMSKCFVLIKIKL
ncbi:hypothetical protein FPHOBKDP_00172 [Listeria phage LPJP1]|nr:hypothetical protein FPHOBKDP_00172 [Listeria phage LPJP1]